MQNSSRLLVYGRFVIERDITCDMTLSLRSSEVSHEVSSNTIHILHIFDNSQQCLKEEIDRFGVLILTFFQKKRTMINDKC